MRRMLIAAFSALCLFSAASRAENLQARAAISSQDTVNVFSSLRSYFDAICTLPVDSINARCDALIESAADDDTRAKIAGTAFDYFAQCPIMGAEGVSVYIADNYFLNKRLRWPNESTYPSLYTFAEFNRSSLLGMEAPELVLESIDGGEIDIREATGGPKILYFYEDACATCARQTPLIVSCLKEYDGDAPLTLYAVYTQADRSAWAKYAYTNFGRIDKPNVRIYNLWDPEGKSEFHKKYSVLTTPSLLMLDADNRICGRKLDAAALSELLAQQQSFDAALYELLDGIRDNMGLDTLSVADVCRAFESRLDGDDALYKDTFLGIYNYLKSQNSYEALQSAAFVADKYILGRKGLWSEELAGSIGDAVYRFRLNPLGEKASDAVLLDRRGKEHMLLSNRGKKYAVLFFNLVSCEQCAAWEKQLLDMRKLMRKSGARITSVYVGPDKEEWLASLKCHGCIWRDLRTAWPESELYSKYDVSIAPKIYLLDADGTVIAKDITPETLAKLLQE